MTAVLEFDAVHHRYGQTPVLQDIGLALHRGEFVGLIGPNGSGKSTLMQLAAGILVATQGEVRVAGVPMHVAPEAAKRQLGHGIDPATLPAPLSGRQVLELVATVRGLSAIPETTMALAESLRATAAIDRALGRCSLGQRQKIGILAGLIGDPPLILLDEPLNGLDPLAAHELKRELAARANRGDAAILLATHAIDIAERFVDRTVLMLDGRLLRQWDAGAMQRMRLSPPGRLEQEMVEELRAADRPDRA